MGCYFILGVWFRFGVVFDGDFIVFRVVYFSEMSTGNGVELFFLGFGVFC